MSEDAGLQEIRGLARDFAAAELRPHVEHWDSARALDADVVPKLAGLGFTGMLVAEEEGGMGFEVPAWAAALEELAWGEPAVALLLAQSVIATDIIARHGTDAQRSKWLSGLAAGELVGCIAFSEDDAGSDLSAMQARAEPAGENELQLYGTKAWVSNGAAADLAIVQLLLEGEHVLVVVPRDAGVRAGERAVTLGLKPLPLVPLQLDGVRVPRDHVLGAAAPERATAEDGLGRISTAAIAVGIAQAALDHAVRYADEREQFGQPLRRFEGIQHKLAEMLSRTTAARALVERAATRPADGTAAAIAKLVAAECAMFVTTEAVQIFGGYGYMRDYPVEKLMRDARAMSILHGTSEVQRLLIAESLYT